MFTPMNNLYPQSSNNCQKTMSNLPTRSIRFSAGHPESYSPDHFSRATSKEWRNQFNFKEQPLAKKLLDKTLYYDMDDTRNALRKLHLQLEKRDVTPENSYYTAMGKYKSGAMLAYFYRQANYLQSLAQV